MVLERVQGDYHPDPSNVNPYPPSLRSLTLTTLTLILTHPAVWDAFKISVDVSIR